MDSKVSVGVCDGLTGLIQVDNQTLLLEPVDENPSSSYHIVYPLASHKIDLEGDQDFGNLSIITRKTRGTQQIDYDEEGNEIVDTVHLEEQPVDYDQPEDDDESNSIDDDDEAVISDTYSEIEDYDVHPPPLVSEATSLEEAERKKDGSNIINSTTDTNDLVDGYSVDKLWEG